MKFLLSLALILFVCGCCKEWKFTPEEDAPFLASGERATLYTRECNSVFAVKGEWNEEAWLVNGNYLKKGNFSEPITEFLNVIGYISKQKETNGKSGGITERVACNRFFIVCIEPIVVIMTEYQPDFSGSRSYADLMGTLTDLRINSFPLINYYHYGSRVPKSSKYQWFSPEFSSEIHTIEEKEGRMVFEVDDKEFEILITPENNWYTIKMNLNANKTLEGNS